MKVSVKSGAAVSSGAAAAGGSDGIAGLVLSSAQRLEYVEAAERYGRDRAERLGFAFNGDDFLMGASVLFAATSGGNGAIPASWVFGVMRGQDPLLADDQQPSAAEKVVRHLRRALAELDAAESHYEAVVAEGDGSLSDGGGDFAAAQYALMGLRQLAEVAVRRAAKNGGAK